MNRTNGKREVRLCPLRLIEEPYYVSTAEGLALFQGLCRAAYLRGQGEKLGAWHPWHWPCVDLLNERGANVWTREELPRKLWGHLRGRGAKAEEELRVRCASWSPFDGWGWWEGLRGCRFKVSPNDFHPDAVWVCGVKAMLNKRATRWGVYVNSGYRLEYQTPISCGLFVCQFLQLLEQASAVDETRTFKRARLSEGNAPHLEVLHECPQCRAA